MSPAPHAPRVLVLDQNNSLPSDRRVWAEITALRDAGYEVVAIGPVGEGRDLEPFARIEGVDIHRFPQSPAAGAVGYLREYASALWRIRALVRRIGRERPFDVVHACNPPDLLLLTALSQRRRGARFVFDHHDLAPELYLVRFGRGKDLLYRLSVLVERLNFWLADVVLATNESYRAIATGRGRQRSEDVFVVRSAPALDRFIAVAPREELRRGRDHLLAYVGIMARQDGVDHALRALAVLRERRDDWHAVFAGEGSAVEEMRALARELGIADHVEFPGWLEQDEVRALLCTADLCMVPDPRTPLSDVSTLVKVAEYLAMSRPVVAFDLTETRVTAGTAAAYAPAGDDRAFADQMAALLDDPERRARMGAEGRERVEQGLAWEHSERELLAAYAHVLGDRAP